MLPHLLVYFAYLIFLFNLCLGSHLYHFSLPLFDEHGTKICDIFGRQADLFDDKNLKISNITIRFFLKNKASSSKSICITSDQANFNFVENIATGSGSIAISSDEFSVTGSEWQLSGNSKIFTLNKDVHVSFI
ncbi:MAG: hypothetical protein LBJ13_04145 [Puniceicoccales bacterium]|jgi:hypothetical protein|nr:hypothetical protein [Puniceicoccales bacterium]